MPASSTPPSPTSVTTTSLSPAPASTPPPSNLRGHIILELLTTEETYVRELRRFHAIYDTFASSPDDSPGKREFLSKPDILALAQHLFHFQTVSELTCQELVAAIAEARLPVLSTQPLPSGWLAYTDPEGETYYYNESTRESTWERPVATSSGATRERLAELARVGPAMERASKLLGIYSQYAATYASASKEIRSLLKNEGFLREWIAVLEQQASPRHVDDSLPPPPPPQQQPAHHPLQRRHERRPSILSKVAGALVAPRVAAPPLKSPLAAMRVTGLDGFLILPIQRVPRYQLLLSQLLECGGADADELRQVASALEETKRAALEMNQVIEVVRDKAALRELLARFVDLESLRFEAAESRRLVKEGRLFKLSRNGGRKEVNVFLLSDVLLLSTDEPGERLRLKREIALPKRDCAAQAVGETQLVLSFSQQHEGADQRIVHLECPSPAVRDEWLQACNAVFRDLEASAQPPPPSRSRAASAQSVAHQLKVCTVCEAPFSITKRRHECRRCRSDVCAGCSLARRVLADSASVSGEAKVARVCDACVVELDCARDCDESITLSVSVEGLRGDVDAVLKTKGALKLVYFKLSFGEQVRGPSSLGSASALFSLALPPSDPPECTLTLLAKSTPVGSTSLLLADVIRHPRALRGLTERLELALEPWAAAAVADSLSSSGGGGSSTERLSVEVTFSLEQPHALFSRVDRLADPRRSGRMMSGDSPVQLARKSAATLAGAPVRLNSNLLVSYESRCLAAPSPYTIRLADLVFHWALQHAALDVREDRKVSLQNKLAALHADARVQRVLAEVTTNPQPVWSPRRAVLAALVKGEEVPSWSDPAQRTDTRVQDYCRRLELLESKFAMPLLEIGRHRITRTGSQVYRVSQVFGGFSRGPALAHEALERAPGASVLLREVTSLLVVHRAVLQDLRGKQDESMLGEALCRIASLIKMYGAYCASVCEAYAALVPAQDGRPAGRLSRASDVGPDGVAKWVVSRQAPGPSSKLADVVNLLESPEASLGALLLAPLERVAEYRSAAKDLLCCTPGPEQVDCTKAVAELDRVSCSLARKIARQPNAELLRDVEAALAGLDQDLSGWFIRAGDVAWRRPSGPDVPLRAFLLSDMLILGRRIVGAGPPRWQVHLRMGLKRASCALEKLSARLEDERLPLLERAGDYRFALSVDEGAGNGPVVLLMPNELGPDIPTHAPAAHDVMGTLIGPAALPCAEHDSALSRERSQSVLGLVDEADKARGLQVWVGDICRCIDAAKGKAQLGNVFWAEEDDELQRPASSTLRRATTTPY